MIRHLALLCLMLVALVRPALAVELGDASLKADRIAFTSGTETLVASGNVEIIFGTSRLEATAIIYDGLHDVIRADGPLRLTEGDRVVILADFAELSGDMRDGILKGARMVLDRQMQLATVEISRTDGRYTQMTQAAVSTCTVSEARPTPLWQIRARRVIHDQERKYLYFEGAQLRIGRVPIAWVPRMRVPDPSVRRASGFLVPGITSSDRLGVGVSAPYFLTFGDYADITLTPHLYSLGSATLGFAYRQRFARGWLDVTGALSHDGQSVYDRRAYLFADGEFRLTRGLRGVLHLETASDPLYLSRHGFSDVTRLNSRIGLEHVSRQTRFETGVTGYRSLSSPAANDIIPFLIGDLNLRHRLGSPVLGGEVGFDLQGLSFTRRSTVDVVGRDGYRLSAGADWSRQWMSRSGLLIETIAAVSADHYRISGDSGFTMPVTRITPVIAADFRLPLIRQSARATTVIEPRAQLVWSNPSGGVVTDEDSQLVEFDSVSLFSLNRFSGQDRQETGLRANIGFGYSRRAASGWAVDAEIGRVFRATDTGQFTAASGLAGITSSYVLAAQISLPDRFRLVQRAVFDDRLVLSRNETRLAWWNDRFDITTGYSWFIKDAAGNTVSDRADWLAEAGWNLASNWRTGASWRYDLVTNVASDAGLALTYSNDCIKVDLSLSRRYVSSSNVSPSTNLALQVALTGFGNRGSGSTAKTRCAAY
ncbi:MAG: LPS assembly protein LptD [Rhodobacteraceae bacterium]|nr:LPS assembly protein LptD [Paracoccaceae bacterium]